MRALPVRRLASTTLCATLVLGTAGPAFASQGDATRDDARTAPRAPAPDAKALLGQAQQLSSLGGVLTPVAELVTQVLKAKDNKLPPEDVKKHTDAVEKAIEAAAESPATAPRLPTGQPGAAQAPPDPKADPLAALRQAIDGLLGATKSGDPKEVVASVPPVLTGLVDSVLGTLLGGLSPKTPKASALDEQTTQPD